MSALRPRRSVAQGSPPKTSSSRNSVYAAEPKATRTGGPWQGTIVSVDPKRRVALFRTHGVEVVTGWATWLVPYTHVEQPFEGMDMVPRPGAQCVIDEVQGGFFIRGFFHPPTGADRGGAAGGLVPNHAGVRPDNLAVGDQLLGSMAGNRVHVTSDGAIILHSKSLSRMILEPLRGLCRFFLRNWELYTEGGHETWWSQQKPEPRSDYSFLAKDDPRAGKDNRVTIEIGKNGDLYQIKGNKRTGEGEQDFETTYRLHFDKEGNLTVEAAGNASVTVDGNAFVKVKQDATLSVDGECDIVSQGKMQIASGGDMNLTAVGNMKLSASRIDLN